MINDPKIYYVTGGTLSYNAECYVVRDADRQLVDSILNGQYVYVLDSRQMGKSSLSVRARRELERSGVRTPFLDLTKFGVKNVSAEQWFAAMLRELGLALGISRELIAYAKSNPELPPVQRFFCAIQDVALDLIDSSIAIFVDEIDVTRSLPFDTDEFFAGIRQCYIGRATDPKLTRLTFCLLGTATPAELIQDTRVSPFNIGRRVELTDLRFEEAGVLGIHLPNDRAETLRRIFYWSGGHPYLTQRLCHAVAESPTGDVDQTCRALFIDHQGKESDDNLAFVRNRLLKNDADITALLELYGRILSEANIKDDPANPLCSILRMSGVVRTEKGVLRIRNRIYAQAFDRQWIQNNLPDAEVRRQIRAFRRGVLRSALIALGALAIVGGLAIYGLIQARVANSALTADRRLSHSLAASEEHLRKSLAETKSALTLAEARRKQSESMTLQASRSAAAAESAGRAVAAAAARERKAATHAEVATATATSLLRHSLVTAAMDRLDSSDPAAAIDLMQSALKAEQSPDEARQDRIRLSFALRSASTLRQVWSGRGPMIDAEFLPGDKTVLTASADGDMSIWDTATGVRIGSVMRNPGLTCIRVAADGATAAVGSSLGIVRLWDLRSHQILRSYSAHEPIKAIDYSERADMMAIGSNAIPVQAHVDLWRLREATHIRRAYEADVANLTELRFSPDAKRLLVIAANFITYGLDCGDGLGDSSVSTCYFASQAQFTNSGASLFINGAGSGNDAGLVQLCSRKGVPIAKYKAESAIDGLGAAFRLSPDGNTLIAASDAGTIQLFDVRSGARLGRTLRTSTKVIDCAVSSDLSLVATASQDGSVRTWNLNTGEAATSVMWQGDKVTHVEFEKSGRRLLTCGHDGTARLWDLRVKGMRTVRIAAAPNGANSVALWTHDGSLLALNEEKNLRWRPGHMPVQFARGYQAVVRWFSYPSDRMIFRRGKEVRVYDLHTNRVLSPAFVTVDGFDRKDSAYGLSRDGRYAFNEYRPRHIRVYDLLRQKYVSELMLGESPTLFDEAWSEGGGQGVLIAGADDRAVTVGTKGLVEIWQLSTGRRIAALHCDTRGEPIPVGGQNWFGLVQNRHNQGYFLRIIRLGDGALLAGPVNFLGGDSELMVTRDRLLLADDGVKCFNTRTWQLTFRSDPPDRPRGYGDYVLTCGPDQRTVFSQGTRRLFDPISQDWASPVLCSESVNHSAFSSDSRYIAVVTGTDLIVYDRLRKIRTLSQAFPAGKYVGFSQDSKMLWSWSPSRLVFWNPATGEQILPAMRDNEISDKLIGHPFSPDQRYFAYRSEGSVVVCEFPRADDPARQNALAQAISRDSLRHLTADAWQKTKRMLPVPFGPESNASATGAQLTEDPYTVEDAIRDVNIHRPDLQGLLEAAEAAARADRWESAEKCAREIESMGAHGAGIYYLSGQAALQQRHYTSAESALKSALGESKQRVIANALFQAAIGTRDFSTAKEMYSLELPSDSAPRRVVNGFVGLLVRAAGGDSNGAKAACRSMVKAGREGKLGEWFDEFAPLEATVSGLLDADPENARYFSKVLHDFSESDPLLGPAKELTRARLGQAVSTILEAQNSSEPVLDLAHALSSPAARSRCARDCRAIVQENDCRSPESALRVLRAILALRELE